MEAEKTSKVNINVLFSHQHESMCRKN